MIREVIEIGLAVAGLVFTAGGLVWQLKRQQKDINGIGKKVRRMQAYLTETAPEEERRRLTDLFKE